MAALASQTSQQPLPLLIEIQYEKGPLSFKTGWNLGGCSNVAIKMAWRSGLRRWSSGASREGHGFEPRRGGGGARDIYIQVGLKSTWVSQNIYATHTKYQRLVIFRVRSCCMQRTCIAIVRMASHSSKSHGRIRSYGRHGRSMLRE
eukprot:5883387-Amphidinium_carterae.1